MSEIEAGRAVLRMTAVERAVYHVPSARLIEVAGEALVAGVDSPSLVELAGLGRAEGGAPELFDRAVAELELNPPVEDGEQRWALARWWAGRIADGSLDPLDGANRIWTWAASELGHPEELHPFVRAPARPTTGTKAGRGPPWTSSAATSAQPPRPSPAGRPDDHQGSRPAAS
ncbi:hypothetical protein ABT095_25015 [Kitasatospora sp. NPDC002227]|uniref:hypothetical protein n=1 Tax=Kitasatospora sp. NPDC002227 TaxID=3154773 RepID=UPI00332E40F1